MVCYSAKLQAVNWRLNLQMAQKNTAKMKLPNALFELNLASGSQVILIHLPQTTCDNSLNKGSVISFWNNLSANDPCSSVVSICSLNTLPGRTICLRTYKGVISTKDHKMYKMRLSPDVQNPINSNPRLKVNRLSNKRTLV